ncbi:transmembrane protein 256 isoform X3 [Petaurus breviceps papuanus]|uniref:transmembrane protein 256 isoform X3 n=1 Tax=Petaurus breviceps papuanus TaxID=3040969 RepID=UPI0036DB06E5
MAGLGAAFRRLGALSGASALGLATYGAHGQGPGLGLKLSVRTSRTRIVRSFLRKPTNTTSSTVWLCSASPSVASRFGQGLCLPLGSHSSVAAFITRP